MSFSFVKTRRILFEATNILQIDFKSLPIRSPNFKFETQKGLGLFDSTETHFSSWPSVIVKTFSHNFDLFL